MQSHITAHKGAELERIMFSGSMNPNHYLILDGHFDIYLELQNISKSIPVGLPLAGFTRSSLFSTFEHTAEGNQDRYRLS